MIIKNPSFIEYAMAEETPTKKKKDKGGKGPKDVTTMAVGEEGGTRTKAIPEEGTRPLPSK